MAKLVVAAVCLAALVAMAVAQTYGEPEQQRLRDAQCRPEIQESPLDACRQVLHRQLTGRSRYGAAPFRWSAGLRMQCCQQLQDVSRECRCAAIRRMVRGYEQTMPPLEEGGGGYYGEPTPEQGGGYYGEGAQRPQQREGYQGYEGMAEGQQQGEGYYGGAARQQGGGRCRCGQRQPGYYGEPAWQQGGGRCRCGQTSEEYGESGRTMEQYGETGRRSTRVGLSKVRQYAARLPAMCRIEPQECSVFSAGEDY
ncbi:hypothetical protein ACP70R_039678 [Stipagrostis hirtigluma subsp. patula]